MLMSGVHATRVTRHRGHLLGSGQTVRRLRRLILLGAPSLWLPHAPLCNIVPCPVSDHCDVSLSLGSLPDSVSRGPSFWKLNTSVLSEPEYVDEISFWSSWQNFKESYSYLSWIGGIWVRRELSLCLSTTASVILLLKGLNSRHFQMSQLEDQGHVASLSEYQSALSELQTFTLEKARSTQVRSCSRWVKEDEFSSAYFFQLKKKRKAESTISSLKVGDCSVTSTSHLCLRHLTSTKACIPPVKLTK